MFDKDQNMINIFDSDQNSNDKFKIDGRQYLLDRNDLDNSYASATSTTFNSHLEN